MNLITLQIFIQGNQVAFIFGLGATAVFWITTAIFVIGTAAAFLFMPKGIDTPDPDQITADELNYPTAAENRPVPYIFGTPLISPNLISSFNISSQGDTQGGVKYNIVHLWMLWGLGYRIDDIIDLRVSGVIHEQPNTTNPFQTITAQTTLTKPLADSLGLSWCEWTTGGQTETWAEMEAYLSNADGKRETTPQAEIDAAPITYKNMATLRMWSGSETVSADKAGAYIGDNATSIPLYSLTVKYIPRILDLAFSADGGNTGDGTITHLIGNNQNLVDGFNSDTWTLTCTAAVAGAGTFSVVSAHDGAKADMTAGVEYDNDFLWFVLTVGDVDYEVGDIFTITTGTNKSDISNDCNPADILYFMYRDVKKIDESRLDKAAFVTAQATMFTEGLGLSYATNQAKNFKEWRKELLRHMDGHSFLDVDTGKYTLTLNRQDFNPETLPIVTDSHYTGFEMIRGSWLTTASRLMFKWTSKRTNKLREQRINNPATRLMIGNVKPVSMSFPYCRETDLAETLAARSVIRAFLPYASGKFKINSTNAAALGLTFRPGEVFKISNSKMGLTELICRVTDEGGDGGFDNSNLDIKWAEEIFSTIDKIDLPIEPEVPNHFLDTPVLHEVVLDCPGGITTSPLVMVLCGPPATGTTTQYQVAHSTTLQTAQMIRDNLNNPHISFKQIGTFEYSGTGLLTGDYNGPTIPVINTGKEGTDSIFNPLDETGFVIEDNLYNVDNEERERSSFYEITNTNAEFQAADTLLLLYRTGGTGIVADYEIVAVRTITEGPTGTFTCAGIRRGLFGTVPKSFLAASTTVYLLPPSINIVPQIEIVANNIYRIRPINDYIVGVNEAVIDYVYKHSNEEPLSPVSTFIENGDGLDGSDPVFTRFLTASRSISNNTWIRLEWDARLKGGGAGYGNAGPDTIINTNEDPIGESLYWEVRDEFTISNPGGSAFPIVTTPFGLRAFAPDGYRRSFITGIDVNTESATPRTFGVRTVTTKEVEGTNPWTGRREQVFSYRFTDWFDIKV